MLPLIGMSQIQRFSGGNIRITNWNGNCAIGIVKAVSRVGR